MDVFELLKGGKIALMDGALGTMLQKNGLIKPGERSELVALENPAGLCAIHRAYVKAGAQILCADTFGANRRELAGSGYSVGQVIAAAVGVAKEAAGGAALVALDVGPIGELLEPSGTLSFEEAVDIFAEMMRAGEAAGADLIVVETMGDLYESKAALIAARESCSLPVMASMTFEESGRTFNGTPVEAMASLAGLGAVALGMNCSLGPQKLIPLMRRLAAVSELPLFLKPNAGLPDPATGVYDMGDEAFAKALEGAGAIGVCLLGGCCGTTPATIATLKERYAGGAIGRVPMLRRSWVASGTMVRTIDGVSPIGERINPTGKKRLQRALAQGDMAYLQAQAVEQEMAGAHILDVNVGAAGIDEVALLPMAVKAVQAVSALPLQLDSANPAALEAALRVVNGKCIVNSVSGEADKLRTVLPLCARYGAAVVGLTLDEAGIPATAQGRVAIAQRILDAALALGMPKEDVLIDALVLTASAQQQAARVTLDALAMVSQELGLKTVLGVSNISFGLPNRALLNRTFLAMALQAGLNLPIVNPASADMMHTIAAFDVLSGADEGAAAYIGAFGGQQGIPKESATQASELTLDAAIERGLKAEAARATHGLLEQMEGMAVVEGYLMPALDRVGAGFEKGIVYLPQLLAAAAAAQSAFEVIRGRYGDAGADGPPIVIATVQGDVHDIGKNIVKVMLENYGFRVIDLGKDVPPAKVVEAVRASGARLVGLSALMTTTLPAMQATIKALREAALPCQVMVGGAVLTAAYAQRIGADFYAKDAKRSVDIAREVFV